ncbi:MAG TPA: dihydrolipoamide acetyltransferase family protein, partial [Gammaproteobacteria bacterium]|nr:dihydrolipoamide acetyltransferase family protein [Gammaproteobacteria bacterium]
MPQLGETVAEGTVSAWHKQVGDTVAKNDVLLEVETDKAAIEVPAPIAGTLAAIRVAAGETVEVGTVLAVIQAAGAAKSDASGDTRPVAKLEQAVVDSPAPGASGIAQARAPSGPPRNDRLRLSPVVRRLVAEHDLDPHAIEGSGRDGRITRSDVLAAIEGAGTSDTRIQPAAAVAEPERSPSATPSIPPATPRITPSLEGERIPFDRIRRLTAEHMVRSKATSPHVLQAIEVDFGAVDAVRGAARERWWRERGYSLTYLPFIARAVCLALKEFPRVNASVDGDSLIVHKPVNLAIAVALDLEGLVAPVIRGAADLTVSGLAQQIFETSRRAREHKLGPDDFKGGTYTISNNGSFGTLLTAPIINQPQVAVLSVDGIAKRPVVIESPGGDAIGIRPMGILAQSFDHRAIDGAYSGAFLGRVKELLEEKDWT